MRVACVGNMNNNFSSLVRHLRDRNVDAELLLRAGEYAHFHPSSDTFQDAWRDFTRVLPWGERHLLAGTSPADVRATLRDFDLIVATDTVPAFLHRAGIPLKVFVPHGSDLFLYPFVEPRTLLRFDREDFLFSRSQRAGIQEAEHIFLGEKGGQFNRSIRRLGVESSVRFVPVPMVYHKEFSPGMLEGVRRKSEWYRRFIEVRERSEVMVFSHCRQFWKTRSRYPWRQRLLALHYKANDVLVRGFAQFVRAHPRVRTSLVMFDYGMDTEASKSLIAELQITPHVAWFPVMPRKEILVGLSMADIGTGEFFGGWYSAGVVYENLALGKPLLHYCNVAGPDMYPFFNVHTEEEIAATLDRFLLEPETFRDIGARGSAWYERNIVGVAMDAYKEVMGGTVRC